MSPMLMAMQRVWQQVQEIDVVGFGCSSTMDLYFQSFCRAHNNNDVLAMLAVVRRKRTAFWPLVAVDGATIIHAENTSKPRFLSRFGIGCSKNGF